MSALAIPAWWLIVPVKGAPHGKSRLSGPGIDRGRLSRALALDSIEAAAEAVGAGRVVVVSDDPVLVTAARRHGCLTLSDPGAGLNGAIRHAHIWIREHSRDHAIAAAVLLGDVPAVRPDDVRAALGEAAAYDRAFVPDRDGSGSVLLTDRSGTLEPGFGAGSARRHEDSGHVRLDLDLPRLRTDVDLSTDLAVAAMLGCGRHTSAVLARAGYGGGMQATVHSYDPSTRSGEVILDDGRVLGFGPDALDDSGLRVLRVGQRLSLTCDDAGGERPAVRRLWIVGIGDGERIG